jgi:hypothetical protein
LVEQIVAEAKLALANAIEAAREGRVKG